MNTSIKNRPFSRDIFYSILAIVIIIVYLLFDGMGMITAEKELFNNAVHPSGTDEYYIFKDMMELHISRMIYLGIALFVPVFTAIRFHISFRKNDTSNYKYLIPYARAFFGIMGFYYILTIGTNFSHEIFTGYYSTGLWKCFFRIVAAFIVFSVLLIDWPRFLSSIKRFPSSHPRLFKALYVFGIALCSCMLLEFQVGSKMNMGSNLLFFNVLYWIILQVFFDVITRNVKIGAFISLGTSYLIGLVNDVVFQFRGNYVMFGDLTVVRTALEVAGNYTYKPGIWFWLALILLLLSVALTVVIRFPKHDNPGVKEIAIRAGAAVVLIVGVVITFSTGMLYKNVSGVGWDYNKNIIHTGYLPYFLSNMNSIKNVVVDGYDPSIVEAAIDSCNDHSADNGQSYPNIIIIQNEAFSDLSVVYDIETNQDYMPFIRSLAENTRKGYLNMSVTGGPTANTEFEILMRSTLNFLPYGAVPYTQYINADLPSAVQVLNNQDMPYHTVAYHPYYSSGYSRTNVYAHFGFDEIVFENDFRDDFPGSDLPRDYLSDEADYRRVEQMYEDFRSASDSPWFCFNVTIQNHGGYTQAFTPSVEDSVYVTNFQATDSLNSYLSLIKMSDDAFCELITYFEQCDEPTIIAMYGDHQPSFDEETLNVLGQHPANGQENELNNFYVPYIIWANYDIEEEDDLSEGVMNTLSTNYFASVVFETAGIELTDYDRYLLDLHERVPAITAIGVWDSEGNYYASASASPYADELSSLEMVQYNLIFDDENRLTDRFQYPEAVTQGDRDDLFTFS